MDNSTVKKIVSIVLIIVALVVVAKFIGWLLKILIPLLVIAGIAYVAYRLIKKN